MDEVVTRLSFSHRGSGCEDAADRCGGGEKQFSARMNHRRASAEDVMFRDRDRTARLSMGDGGKRPQSHRPLNRDGLGESSRSLPSASGGSGESGRSSDQPSSLMEWTSIRSGRSGDRRWSPPSGGRGRAVVDVDYDRKTLYERAASLSTGFGVSVRRGLHDDDDDDDDDDGEPSHGNAAVSAVDLPREHKAKDEEESSASASASAPAMTVRTGSRRKVSVSSTRVAPFKKQTVLSRKSEDDLGCMEEITFDHPEADEADAEASIDLSRKIEEKPDKKNASSSTTIACTEEDLHDIRDNLDDASDTVRIRGEDDEEHDSLADFNVKIVKTRGIWDGCCFGGDSGRRCCRFHRLLAPEKLWLFVGPSFILAAFVLPLIIPSGGGDHPMAPQGKVEMPQYLESNLVDWTEHLPGSPSSSDVASSSNTDTVNFAVPLLWAVPLSAPALMEDIFGKCYGLVQASGVGVVDGHGEDDTLNEVDVHGSSYLNVDVTTSEGLERAADLDLAGSGMADVVTTPLLHGAASSVFDPEHRGRLMAVFRHPVDRIAAEYHFLQQGQFSGDYPNIADMTFGDYVESDYAGDNWITRHLVLGDKPNANRELTELELILAKEILRRKAVVGLYDDLPAAVEQFASSFGFDAAYSDGGQSDATGCVADLVERHLTRERESFPVIEEGGDVWNAIVEKNWVDMELYRYVSALHLYQVGAYARL